MLTFKVDINQLQSAFYKAYTDAQKKYTKACIATVNVQAALTKQNAQTKLNENFTLRNTFSQRSILYTSCPQSVTKLEDIQSEVGATTRADYLERQEKGGIHSGTNGKNLAIPTTAARGGTNTGLIRKKYALRKGSFIYAHGRQFASRSAYLVAMAYVGFREKKPIYYKKGVFSVDTFRKSGNSIHFALTLIRNRKYKSTKTPESPWLQPSAQAPSRDCQAIFNSQMQKQG